MNPGWEPASLDVFHVLCRAKSRKTPQGTVSKLSAWLFSHLESKTGLLSIYMFVYFVLQSFLRLLILFTNPPTHAHAPLLYFFFPLP